MQQPDDSRHCIHIAYLAEGYRKEEMPKFLADVRKAMGALFAHEPFKSLQGKFSIVAVESPSSDSGTSEPSKGIWKQTALGSHFDTFYSDRYLTTPNIRRMHDWLAGIPYEHIIALVNTDRYGGAVSMANICSPPSTTNIRKKWWCMSSVTVFVDSPTNMPTTMRRWPCTRRMWNPGSATSQRV